MNYTDSTRMFGEIPTPTSTRKLGEIPTPTDREQLTPNFRLSEFRCPCCRDVRREQALELALRLQPVRDEFGPVLIRSGFRCPVHNVKVNGAMFSQHLVGRAADIACFGDHDRHELVKLLLKHGFNRLGLAAGHVHADIAKVGQYVIWTYY